jgi:hypothetical protein
MWCIGRSVEKPVERGLPFRPFRGNRPAFLVVSWARARLQSLAAVRDRRDRD